MTFFITEILHTYVEPVIVTIMGVYIVRYIDEHYHTKK